MTYCVGILLDDGLVMAADSRTHAGIDNFAKFCKMTVFERPGDRVLVLLSSGSLAGTQAVVNVLRQRCELDAGLPNLWTARTMFDVAVLVSDAMRDIERRDGPYLEGGPLSFNASFILGGQIEGEAPRLFRIYAEGNFVEAGEDTPFLQTGEAKYGKPIIDRVIARSTTLADATKCVLVSFDSTMRSNLSVGMPIDLACYKRDSLALGMRQRFDIGDPYFTELSREWGAGVRRVFRQLPDLHWFSPLAGSAADEGVRPLTAGTRPENPVRPPDGCAAETRRGDDRVALESPRSENGDPAAGAARGYRTPSP